MDVVVDVMTVVVGVLVVVVGVVVVVVGEVVVVVGVVVAVVGVVVVDVASVMVVGMVEVVLTVERFTICGADVISTVLGLWLFGVTAGVDSWLETVGEGKAGTKPELPGVVSVSGSAWTAGLSGVSVFLVVISRRVVSAFVVDDANDSDIVVIGLASDLAEVVETRSSVSKTL